MLRPFIRFVKELRKLSVKLLGLLGGQSGVVAHFFHFGAVVAGISIVGHAALCTHVDHAEVVAWVAVVGVRRHERVVLVVEQCDLAVEGCFGRESKKERLFVWKQLDTWIVHHKAKGNIGFVGGLNRCINTGVFDPSAGDIFEIVVRETYWRYQGNLAGARLRLAAGRDGMVGLHEYAVGVIGKELDFEFEAAVETCVLCRNCACCEEGQQADEKCTESIHSSKFLCDALFEFV